MVIADWLLECELDDVDLTALEEISADIVCIKINSVRDAHNITFKQLKLTVSKADGVVCIGEVTVKRHTSTSATVSLNTAGQEIKGSVEKVFLDGLMMIGKAQLDVFIGVTTSTTGRLFLVQINGVVLWQEHEINAGLFIDSVPWQTAKWTVYGEFEGDLNLSRFSTSIGDTWLNRDLTQVAFFAGNGSTVSEQVPDKFKCPVKKGIQLCATWASSLSPVNGVMKTEAGRLTVCFASSAEKLTVEVILPIDKYVSYQSQLLTKRFFF